MHAANNDLQRHAAPPTRRIGILSAHVDDNANSTRTRRSINTEQHTALETNNVISSGIPSRGGFKVTVLGAAGGIGQPLCLLLKQDCSNMIDELSLYDVANTAGVAADLSHISTKARVTSHTGPDQLSSALYGSHIVIIPAGVPRKPGMSRDDLFKINAGIVKTLLQGVASYCPQAWIAIISNPVNSTVPIAAEVLKREGVLNPRKLFGVTTLDVVRATTFIGDILGVDPKDVSVPVVGGHAGKTILPLLSSSSHCLGGVSMSDRKALMERIQDAGTEVVKAKAGAGSATLSMAYAAAEFTKSCLKAMSGEQGIVECAYVISSVTDVPFFSSQLRLGAQGIEQYLPLPRMSEMERENFEAMIPELRASIKKGTDFVANS
ncbi:hypothetical protein M9434_003919 [Picochlorum sp. BPE23]|nr:hypothetical protein M9434_003919 [Picochlorum sp. BPE23]